MKTTRVQDILSAGLHRICLQDLEGTRGALIDGLDTHGFATAEIKGQNRVEIILTQKEAERMVGLLAFAAGCLELAGLDPNRGLEMPDWYRGRSYTLDGERIDMADFLHVNAEVLDTSDMEALRDLQPQQEYRMGGGASPEAVIQRVS